MRKKLQKSEKKTKKSRDKKMKKKCERSLGFKIIFDDIHSKLEAT